MHGVLKHEISDSEVRAVSGERSERCGLNTVGDKSGYVYVLTSPATASIKIGGTDYPPLKRIREINSAEPYKSLGPWSLADFRQVNDWKGVESFLHYCFRSKQNKDVDGQKELFDLPVQEVSEKLSSIDEAQIIKKPKIDRLFQDELFVIFLIRLFRFTVSFR